MLQEQIQQLKVVLGAVQRDSGGAGTAGGKARGRPGSASMSGGGDNGAGSMRAELSASRRCRAQAVQLQRQVALMSEELQVWNLMFTTIYTYWIWQSW